MPGRLFVHAAYRPGLAYHAILDAQCPVMRLNPLFMPLLFVASGHAAGLESLSECRRLIDDRARLACYDRVAAGVPPLPATNAADAQPTAIAAPEQPPLESSMALPETPRSPSLLGQAWELDPEERGRILRIRPYKPVYVLPFFRANQPNHHPNSPAAEHSASYTALGTTEAKLQISLKSKLYEDLLGRNSDLWFGYTQTSRWQVYTGADSRPFRETNHEPEAMLVWRTDYTLGGWRGRFAALGINHQSNGRALPFSRSWNRIIGTLAFEKADWTVTLRPWWRIKEDRNTDDNPDIESYLGRADLQIVHRMKRHQFSLLLRHNLEGGSSSRGAIQVDYAFPIAGELRGHLQWFSGYGESMIDYNHRATYYGLGVSLLEWY